MRKENLKVLVVSNLYVLTYKVLFCLRDAGIHNVYVLANNRASRLRYTRFCKHVSLSKTNFDGSETETALAEINDQIRKLDIDVVLPGDQHSTRLLTMIQSRLAAPCFPLPDDATFKILYDKWEFRRICEELDVPYPKSVLFADKESLMERIASDTLLYPAICKPMDLEAGNGIMKLTRENAMKQAQRVFYKPILVQQFIEGEDIGASVYCEQGIIKNFIAHSLKRQLYHTFRSDTIYDTIARIVGRLRVSGVYNFDMRLTPNGEIYFLECNPRFFLKMMMSALAGINFVAAGLELPTRASLEDGTDVRMPWAFGFDLLTRPKKISRSNVAAMCKLATDPVPFASEIFRIGWFDIEAPINYYTEAH